MNLDKNIHKSDNLPQNIVKKGVNTKKVTTLPAYCLGHMTGIKDLFQRALLPGVRERFSIGDHPLFYVSNF